MKLDYDLIIITDNLAGIKTAEYAVSLRARVALIIIDDSLNKVIKRMAIQRKNLWFLESGKQFNTRDLIFDIQHLVAEKYLSTLEANGVDIITDSFEFDYLKNTKKLIIKTPKYKLKATKYILSLSRKILNYNESLDSNYKFLNIDDLVDKSDWQMLPKNLIIIGSSLITINLAQVLNKLGKQVTIITPQKKLLLAEDEDINFGLQTFLEAQGINILTNSQVSQIRLIDGKKWLQAGNKAIEAEEIIIDNKCINYLSNQEKQDNFGLNKIGIDINSRKIDVNSQLQSCHSQVYLCGDLLGGYNLNNLAEYEGKIAVNNALFLGSQSVNYQYFAYTLPTYLQIQRVGYSQSQAQEIYGDNLKILKFRLPQLLWQKTTNNSTTLVKIICDTQNNILGGHFFNLDNQEILTIIANLIKQNKKIYSLFEANFSQNRSLEIISEIYKLWLAKYSDENKWVFDLRETFLLWTRN